MAIELQWYYKPISNRRLSRHLCHRSGKELPSFSDSRPNTCSPRTHDSHLSLGLPEWLGACLAFHDEQTLAEEKLQLLAKMDHNCMSCQCHIETLDLSQSSSISAIQGVRPLQQTCWGRSSLFLCPHSALQKKHP